MCELNTPTIVTRCHDNGTGANASDDTFSYTIKLTGSNTGAEYNISGDDMRPALTYNTMEGAFGSFLISDGYISLDLTDSNDATCTLTNVVVPAPATCSGDVDIELSKAAFAADGTTAATSAKRGDTIVYILTATNASATNTATGVQASDALPAGVTLHTTTSPVASQGSYDPVSGLWDIGTLTPGQSVTLTITVTVD